MIEQRGLKVMSEQIAKNFVEALGALGRQLTGRAQGR